MLHSAMGDSDVSDSAIRDAVKWLLAASAGVLAVLTASLPFSTIGHLPTPLLVLVGVLLIAAALLVSLSVVLAAGSLLADTGVSFDDLVGREVAAKQGDTTTGPVSDQAHLERDSLLSRLRVLDSRLHAQHARPVLLRDRMNAAWAMTGSAAAVEQSQASADIELYLSTANRFHAADRFEALLRLLKRVGWIVPTAVVGFLVLVSSQPVAVPVTEAVPVTVYLQHDASSAGFGKACRTDVLRGVAIQGTLDTPEVVVPASGPCHAGRLTVSAEVGVVVPQAK